MKDILAWSFWLWGGCCTFCKLDFLVPWKKKSKFTISLVEMLICNVADMLVIGNGVDKFPSQLLMNRFYLQKITDPYGFIFFIHKLQRTGQISMSSFLPLQSTYKEVLEWG